MPDDVATTPAPAVPVGPGGASAEAAPAAPATTPKPGPPELSTQGGARTVAGGEPPAPAEAGPLGERATDAGAADEEVDWKGRYGELRARERQLSEEHKQLRRDRPDLFDEDGRYVGVQQEPGAADAGLFGQPPYGLPETPWPAMPGQPPPGAQAPGAEQDPFLSAISYQLALAQAQGPVQYQRALTRLHQQFPQLGLLPTAPRQAPPAQPPAQPVDFDRRFTELYQQRRAAETLAATQVDRALEAMRADYGEQFMQEPVRIDGAEMPREDAAVLACERFGITDPEEALRRAGDVEGLRQGMYARAYAAAYQDIRSKAGAQHLPVDPRQLVQVSNPDGISQQQLVRLGYPTKPAQRGDTPRT